MSLFATIVENYRGSQNAKMGEIALSNGGILFFDELPHFPSNILEALREPLEDYKILISRVNSKVLYSTKFTFVAAMNPCPCVIFINKYYFTIKYATTI